MPFQNPKAVTIKLPRVPITPVDKDYMLDVALACACPGLHNPANLPDRREFERHIMTSSAVNQKVKAALANLTEQQRSVLFR